AEACALRATRRAGASAPAIWLRQTPYCLGASVPLCVVFSHRLEFEARPICHHSEGAPNENCCPAGAESDLRCACTSPGPDAADSSREDDRRSEEGGRRLQVSPQHRSHRPTMDCPPARSRSRSAIVATPSPQSAEQRAQPEAH